MSQTKKKRRPIISPQLWQNKRFAAGVSIVLAIIVWVMFAVVGGEDQERIITGVTVDFIMENLPPTAQHLQVFWQTPEDNPHQLTIDVTVRAARNEVITAEDIHAFVVLGGVFESGPAQPEIRVSTPNERVQIVGYYPLLAPWLYFDHHEENTFGIYLDVVGDITVPEDYFAPQPVLLQPTVQVSGPQNIVRQVHTVRAALHIEDELTETTPFHNLPLTAYDHNGAPLSYLTFDGGQAEITAVVHVWQRAQLDSGVAFMGLPNGTQFSARITPSRVNVAAANVPENGMFIVGNIEARELAPGHNHFRFAVADMTEVHFFTLVEYFEVEVDLRDYDMASFTLPAAQIRLPDGSPYTATFGSVTGVTIVAPADVISEMTAQHITAVVVLNDELTPGMHRLPLQISTLQGGTWVFGEHFVMAQLTEG